MTLSEFDNEIRKDYNVVCGCDEAGRGPLAGDVFAAAVIFDKDTVIEGINDSKKLTAKKREELFDEIMEKAVDFSIQTSTVEEIEDVTAYSLNDEIQRKEILEILEKFLESLKKGDCDIFIRRYWYMDSISEISARHGISESRIKSSLYRSRKKLWERVKHLYGKRI